MRKYTFKLWYIYKEDLQFLEYTKLCKYPKKTKLYRDLIYLLDNDSRTIRVDIN